jgi:hypothetical protein
VRSFFFFFSLFFLTSPPKPTLLHITSIRHSLFWCSGISTTVFGYYCLRRDEWSYYWSGAFSSQQIHQIRFHSYVWFQNYLSMCFEVLIQKKTFLWHMCLDVYRWRFLKCRSGNEKHCKCSHTLSVWFWVKLHRMFSFHYYVELIVSVSHWMAFICIFVVSKQPTPIQTRSCWWRFNASYSRCWIRHMVIFSVIKSSMTWFKPVSKCPFKRVPVVWAHTHTLNPH